jgi:hypothetical protein
MYHPNRRRELLLMADVSLFQARVIDHNGEEFTVVVWRCGPDILVSRTLDGLFDRTRRKVCPKWLRDQLETLPPSRRFAADGTSYSHGKVEADVPSVPTSPPEAPVQMSAPEAGEEDDDLRGFEEG